MNFKEHYQKIVIPKMLRIHGYKNSLAVPKLVKVVINSGLGKIREDQKLLNQAKEDLKSITGQAAEIRRSKKAISGFKLRQGEPIGLRVTLRGKRMYDFCQKLVGIVLPRIRDFRGLNPQGFDGGGNFNLGISEQIVFPEIKAEKAEKIFPLQITLVTTTSDDRIAKSLLESFGFIFAENKNLPQIKKVRTNG